MAGLADRGIETRPFFWPMHLQPVFCRIGMFPGVSCPVAEHLGRRGLYLPSGLTLGEEQIEYVSRVLREVLN
jgi:perosamine synthetase